MTNDENTEWGLVHKIIEKDNFVVQKSVVIAGERTDYKFHERKHELLFCTSGEGVLILNDMEIPLKVGGSFHIYKRDRHAIRNTGTENMTIYQIQYGDECKFSDSVRIPYDV